MKKKLNLLFLIISISNVLNSQTIALDANFGDKGFFTLPLAGESSFTTLTILDEGETALVGVSVAFTNNETNNFIVKLTSNGSLDQNFGDNGILDIADFDSEFDIQKHLDGFLVHFRRTNTSTSQQSIFRYDFNGNLDISFADNGELRTPRVNQSSSGDSLVVLNDNTFLITNSVDEVNRYTTSGQLDTSFGNNGMQNASVTHVFGVSENNEIFSTTTTSIVKQDIDGELVESFGEEGVFSFPVNDQSDYDARIFDDQFVYSITIGSPPISRLYKIDLNGVLDTNFNSNGFTDLKSVNDPRIQGYFAHTFSSTIFYTMGDIEQNNNFGTAPFFEAYNLSGESINLNNEPFYIENNLPSLFFNDVQATENSLFAVGISVSNQNIARLVLAKYALSNRLSINETIVENIKFINPIKDKLVVESPKKITKIDVFDINGIKVATSNNATVDTRLLASGVYIMKASFEDATLAKKIIKL